MNPWLNKSTRILRYSLVTLAALGGVLLFLLASASANSNFFERNYPILLSLNAAAAAALLGLLILLTTRLLRRYRQGVFGSRLLLRMSLSFALVGLLPGLAVYLVSVQFLSKSIDSWFNVRVDNALESGLKLGQSALDSLLADLSAKTRAAAFDVSAARLPAQINALNRIREQLSVDEVTLLSSDGRVLGSSSTTLGSLLPSHIASGNQLRQVLLSRPRAQLETDEKNGVQSLNMRVVAMVPGSGLSLNSEERFLQIVQEVPRDLANTAQAVQSVYEDYQRLSLSRTGLRKIYGVTLTLALLLTVFLAMAAAFWISNRLATPLLWLAEGTRAVAGGNFEPVKAVIADDELRELVDSFNTMTQQLSEARQRLESNQAAIRQNNEFLQSLLSNLSAGVLVFNRQLHLTMFNDGAQRIFDWDLKPLLHRPLDADPRLLGFSVAMRAGFLEHTDVDPAAHWQKQIELPRADRHAAPKILLVRGSRLPGGDDAGYVVVCDDISALVSAQRTVAWGEVARRLAHEIKNPLTPIQLSAERLQMKLAAKLDESDAGMLQRATKTIINQVGSMKRLVDSFRDYARLPPAELSPINLNELVCDVLALYGVVDSEVAEPEQRIRPHLAKDLPSIMGDTSQLRQVIHNLLQNAHDAIAERMLGQIDIRTESVPGAKAGSGNIASVRLLVCDNGPGFSEDLLARAFEPYVTTKLKGTGLGLPIVRKIIDEHGARIVIRNRFDDTGVTIGALVELTFSGLKSTASSAARPGDDIRTSP